MYLFSLPCRQAKNCFVQQTKGVAFTNIISLLFGRTCCFVFCIFSPLMILQFFVPFQPFFALHSCYFCPFPSNLYQYWTRPFSIHFCLVFCLHNGALYMNYFSIRLYVIHDHQLCCGLISCFLDFFQSFFSVQFSAGLVSNAVL